MLLFAQFPDVVFATPVQYFTIKVDTKSQVILVSLDPLAGGIGGTAEILAQHPGLAITYECELFFNEINFRFGALHGLLI